MSVPLHHLKDIFLSPNGRLGDLLSLALRNKETHEEAAAIGRTLRGLKLEGLPGVGG